MLSNYGRITYMEIFLFCSLYCCVKTGRSNNSQKIADGEYASVEDFPYVVQLKISKEEFCTGAIISKFWVLTAASCLDTDDIQVYAGIDDGKSINVDHLSYVVKIIRHPNHSRKKAASGNDIGLIKVEKPFVLSKKVGILKLSDDIWPEDTRYSRVCIAAGWGNYKKGATSHRLRKLHLEARHGSKGCLCYRKYDQKLVCSYGEASICKGDTGLALICDDKGVAVASFVYELKDRCNPVFLLDDKCSEPNHYTAFTYICPHLNWIKEYVPEVPGTPESCQATHNARTSNYIKLLLVILQIKYYTH